MASRAERELIAEAADREDHNDLSRLQRQLANSSGSVPIQGYLLKRSENLRLWNQRWFSLDPSTARMEYRIQRTDVHPRGTILFGPDSTVTMSPINFHGAKQYDGCCLYVGTAGQKEYFLCAETPGAARAWVLTLRAAVRVLKAHREAVQSLAGGKPSVTGAVAAATQAAIEAAREAQEEVAAANRKTVLSMAPPRLLSSLTASTATNTTAPATATTAPAPAAATSTFNAPLQPQPQSSQEQGDAGLDSVTLLKETLKVKDDEIRQLVAELRERDSMVAELAEQGNSAAAAADAAADAAAAAARERDSLKEVASRLCAELEGKFEEGDVAVAAARSRAAEAEGKVEGLEKECEGLRVLLREEEAGRRAAEAEAKRWREEAERLLAAASSAPLPPVAAPAAAPAPPPPADGPSEPAKAVSTSSLSSSGLMDAPPSPNLLSASSSSVADSLTDGVNPTADVFASPAASQHEMLAAGSLSLFASEATPLADVVQASCVDAAASATATAVTVSSASVAENVGVPQAKPDEPAKVQ